MQSTEDLLRELRRNWTILNERKCSGTVAFVDLSNSSQFKMLFPSPDIWFERLYSFMEIVKSVARKVLDKPFIKFLGDGVLIFQREDEVNPKKYVEFTEELAKRVASVNEKRYSPKPWTIEFKCSLDYGSDIYVLENGDPQGTAIDRAYRIADYLMPNMIGASKEFYNHVGGRNRGIFTLAGKAYLKGVSEQWQEIYALNTIKGFVQELNQEQKKRETLIDIWEMGKADKPIWVVSGAIRDETGEDEDTYTLQHGDSNALIEIIHTLSKIYPDREVKIVNSQEYLKQNGPAFDNDIVCVSGPAYNLVTERIVEKLRSHIHFESDKTHLPKYDDSILVYSEKGRRFPYSTERDKNGRITSDVAFFAKIKDAFANGRYLYLMMGNETQGTYAGTNLFGISSPYLLSNYEYIKTKLPSGTAGRTGFGILAKSVVIEDYVEPIHLDSSKGSKLFVIPTVTK